MSQQPPLWDKLGAQQLGTLEAQIASSLNQKQGFRLGESTVISQYVHNPNPRSPGEVQIVVNRDAGQVLAQLAEPGQAIHVDVFHEPACVQIQPLSRALARTLQGYLSFRTNQEPPSKDLKTQSYTEKIYLKTGTGAGNLAELLALPEQHSDSREKPQNHVHLLLKNLPQADIILIPCLVDTVETELARQEVEIRKVASIFHTEKKDNRSSPQYFLGLEPGQHKLWHLATTLATFLSSPEDAIEFLQAFQPGLFHRKQSFAILRNKHGNLREIIINLAEAGLIKKGWFADTLTREGKELLEFIVQHQRELESQIRKILRSVPVPRSHYQTVRNFHFKSRQKQYTYISKTTTHMKDTWLGSIAVPETLIQAAKNKLLQNRRTFRVERADIKVHEQEISKPVDICLIIDGSTSMAGPKMKAVWHLAEHLLLTTRDKVAVVVFQQRRARVVVPFTRNYTRLKLGLRSIRPQGMTPLADGLVEALQLVKSRHVRNPLLVLITDGVPTFGKWTLNPQQDALKAVKMFLEARLKLICIGVAPNREFLEELARQAQGNVYIVDNLEDRAALIEIVLREKKFYIQ